MFQQKDTAGDLAVGTEKERQRDYSYRSATIGSTRDARRAGR